MALTALLIGALAPSPARVSWPAGRLLVLGTLCFFYLRAFAPAPLRPPFG